MRQRVSSSKIFPEPRRKRSSRRLVSRCQGVDISGAAACQRPLIPRSPSPGNFIQFELFRFVHWDCRRHRSDFLFGLLAFLTGIPIFRRIRCYYSATEFPSVYGVIRCSSFPIPPALPCAPASITCRHSQFPYLTVPTGLARFTTTTTVFRRAIKALPQFPCYFVISPIIHHDSVLRSGTFESGCARC